MNVIADNGPTTMSGFDCWDMSQNGNPDRIPTKLSGFLGISRSDTAAFADVDEPRLSPDAARWRTRVPMVESRVFPSKMSVYSSEFSNSVSAHGRISLIVSI